MSEHVIRAPGDSGHANSARDIYASHHARIQVGHNYYTTAELSLSQRQNNILKNLSTLPYRDRKNHNPRRVPGTCEWFLAHPLFQQWRDGPSSMLWVSADPGCGKSVLARHLIDHELKSRPESASETPRTTCYFFFKDGLDDQRSLQGALRCILYQLLTNRRELFSQPVLDRFESESYLLNSTRSLWELLVETTRMPEAGQIICLLDAIDECEDEGRDELYELCDDFLKGRDTGYNTQFKLLLTSRPHSDIRAGLSGLSLIHLKGETEEEVSKIAGEIKLVIEDEIESIDKRFPLSSDQKEGLRRRLLGVENRTYLWAHLTLDLIRKDLRAGKRDVIESSGRLPQTVEEAYNSMLNKSPQPTRARKMLQLIVAATRPLSLSEMAVAMKMQKDGQYQGELVEQREEDFGQHLRDLCGLFVIVGPKVSLLHQTAREFLVEGTKTGGPETPTGMVDENESLIWRHSISLQESHLVLAQACIWSLLSTGDSTAVMDNNTSSAHNHHAFYRYAAMNWHFHVRKSNYHDVGLMRRLCVKQSVETSYPPWFEYYYYSQTAEEGRRLSRTRQDGGLTPVQIASYCGVLSLVHRLLEEEDLADVVSLTDYAKMSGRSAVSLAAEQGFSDVVKEILHHFPAPLRHLLKHDPLEVKDSEGRTPLATAALNGHEEVVDLLLREGARVDVKDNAGSSPLIYAICSGRQTVVDLLLAGREEPEQREIDEQLQTLLVSAIFNNKQSIVQRVLDTKRINLGMNIKSHFKSSDDRGGYSGFLVSGKMQWPETLLSMASYIGKSVIAQLFVEGGADLHHVGGGGLTPFHWAVIGDNHQIIRVLLALGSDPKLSIGNGLTPMALSISIPTMQLLFDNGAVVPGLELWSEERKQCAQTIMEQCRPQEKFNSWLYGLLQGREPQQDTLFPLLMMILPAVCGREDLLETIFEPGQDINIKTSMEGFGLIHLTAMFDSGTKCLKTLLHVGADPVCMNRKGQTALHLAALAGNSEAVAELLSNGVRTRNLLDFNHMDRQGRTVLSCAIISGSTQTVKVLLDNGTDPNGVGDFDYTPLHCAMEAPVAAVYSITELLLAYGAKPDSIGSNWSSPLHYITTRSALQDAPAVVRMLLSNGADPNARIEGGDTPLHSVARASKGFEVYGVAQVLLEHGADPTAENNRGETSLSIAVRECHDACTRALLQQAIFSSGP